MDTASRLLQLLSVLPARPRWSGDELADRLGVTPRTVRRDVTRLRDLGYAIHTEAGAQGGYRLGTDGRLPPLLLDDDEAVAMAVGLRLAEANGIGGVEVAALTALAKLIEILPTAARERVRTVESATVALQPRPSPRVDVEVLAALATACRWSEHVRFSYRTHDGSGSERSVEPYRMVHSDRRWYLVGRDRRRRAWRTFRADRISGVERTGHHFVIEDPPDERALVSEATTVASWGIKAVLRLDLDAKDAISRYPPSMCVVEPAGPGRSLLTVGANELGDLVGFAAGIGCDFVVLEPPELRQALAAHARTLLRRHASGPADGVSGPAGLVRDRPRAER